MHLRQWLLPSLLALGLCLPVEAQRKITTPKEEFGFHIGDDYMLATYTQFEKYVQKLAKESDRMKLVSIGKTAEGREQYMAIVSSPANIKNLARLKEISHKMATAEGVSEEAAQAMAKEGKAVVWIDGGLHATEVLGAAQLIEMIYQMNSRSDEETLRILNDVVILFVHANPDGMELVSTNYMRNPEPAKRRYVAERLYQKYVGHDNNRDFFMSTQKETQNINRQLYLEWIPQILYNHHQQGPAGTVLFCPPFRDPASYFYDPLMMIGVDQVGAAMHARFTVEGKPGFTTREGSNFSVWYNGGLRTTAYYHNMIGLLTESAGNPTPIDIPFVPSRQLQSKTTPYPIAPQEKWHFRQSIEYSVTANRAVLDYASRHKDNLLYNIWKMGTNSIERGKQDHWTMTPARIDALNEKIAKERIGADRGGIDPATGVGGGVVPAKYYQELIKPELRDPRGYILPADQADFNTAVVFTQTLQWMGITAHRATADFTVAGKTYKKGSIVYRAAQAFRPHLIDMFEPQNYPNDFRYPGGPPIAPYDSAGWTLAYQMGVKFDRILDDFNGPFEKIEGLIQLPEGKVSGAGAAGYLLSHKVNDSFKAVNRLLAAGEAVYWLKDPLRVGDVVFEAGTIYVPSQAKTAQTVAAVAKETNVTFVAAAQKPVGDALKLKPIKIGLWDNVGGSMASGWTRWLFEQYQFPFELVYPPSLDQGDLRSKFDVLVFVTGAISERGRFGGAGGGDVSTMTAEWRERQGRVTREKTVPQLKKFLESGGTVLTIGSSTGLAQMLGLPVGDQLVERMANGAERRLPNEKFYVPGSVLEVAIDNTNPLAYGMEKKADIFFEDSPVFKLKPDAGLQNVKPIAWFDNSKPLRSGWAWGQQYLEGGVAVAEAKVGEGKLFLYGPEVIFRAQPHGTFKLFFNALYYGTAEQRRLEK
ncbi:M14 family metallopeptidase [Bryobacter aggregatus]|uniref:M14 family metallopeptidase n=1 Tax=Bryobacter aggregatus TaxID=360054 RepID=UPI0004E1AB28|nr:M14 metallopeptidase family protein [Bryobacter aggregatus]